MDQSLTTLISPLIFITGLPRSGTTWAGHVITAALESALVEEPFNWEFHPQRAHFHMRYLPKGQEDTAYVDTLRRTIFSWKKPRRTLRVLLRRRLVVRDVLTCFAVETLWNQWQPKTLIMIRHPAAMASSWARVNFKVQYRIDNLLKQPRLVADHLAPFQEHLHLSNDYYFQIGAYWGACYYVLRRMAADRPEWQWVRHETLCTELEEGFVQILDQFDLGMALQGYELLQQLNRPPAVGQSPFDIFRLSAQEPDKWKSLLTEDQVSAVLQGSAPFGVLQDFYPDSTSMGI